MFLLLAMVLGIATASEETCGETNLGETSPNLGYVIKDVDVKTIDKEGIARILDATSRYGTVVIQGQPLSRAEQVEFSNKLGDVVILPPSFEGLDPEPNEPAIQRVTNYWANGTWKGPTHSFGAYWHQDGQFWPRSHRWIFSMLACAEAPESGGETGFADLRLALQGLDEGLLAQAKDASILASVRDIKDFVRNGIKEEIDLFDDVTHPIIDTYPGSSTSDQDLLYIGSPHMRVKTNDKVDEATDLLPKLFDQATKYTYFHKWKPGDIVIWDNTITLHKAFPYNNTADVRRELYRTQFRRPPTHSHLDLYPSPPGYRPRWLLPDGSMSYAAALSSEH